ncbi:MAG: hypothetical protein COV44_03640 [Deltaproteobacteria bacterium CG11_big_fil_rev_8_21_14_0_20_45_16]|nr:MAG: hypothetical protein COV44_03640 [Deltaproteobacteria bacterium CG11_big_fil_rev_8_21_14_0_20_45_16]
MLYQITIPQFTKMLNNLSLILDRAAQYASSKKIDFETLLHSRLAPDQFPLSRQLQITCDTAKFCASRLCAKEGPVHDDKERSLQEFKTRIEQTISYLGMFTESDFKGAEDRKISQPRWEGKNLTGTEYTLQHAIPNFYFHLTTAYAILRHNGVDIGKKDYLGPMPFKT